MVWALDKMDSPADRSPGEQVPTEVAGIGTIVRPGKVRSYALPLNDFIARESRVRFGGGDIYPVRRWCGQAGRTQRPNFLM